MYATMLALEQGGRDVVATMFGVQKKVMMSSSPFVNSDVCDVPFLVSTLNDLCHC